MPSTALSIYSWLPSPSGPTSKESVFQPLSMHALTYPLSPHLYYLVPPPSRPCSLLLPLRQTKRKRRSEREVRLIPASPMAIFLLRRWIISDVAAFYEAKHLLALQLQQQYHLRNRAEGNSVESPLRSPPSTPLRALTPPPPPPNQPSQPSQSSPRPRSMTTSPIPTFSTPPTSPISRTHPLSNALTSVTPEIIEYYGIQPADRRPTWSEFQRGARGEGGKRRSLTSSAEAV